MPIPKVHRLQLCVDVCHGRAAPGAGTGKRNSSEPRLPEERQ
jgi:hypothetical protein